jgi:hypothetical protein
VKETISPGVNGSVKRSMTPPKKLLTTSLDANPNARPPIPPKASVDERGILRKAEMHSIQEKIANIQSTTDEERSIM